MNKKSPKIIIEYDSVCGIWVCGYEFTWSLKSQSYILFLKETIISSSVFYYVFIQTIFFHFSHPVWYENWVHIPVTMLLNLLSLFIVITGKKVLTTKSIHSQFASSRDIFLCTFCNQFSALKVGNKNKISKKWRN